MFTGIVRAVSAVKKIERKNSGLILALERPKGWKFKKGDSVSVNGVCLTVTKVGSAGFVTELMPETAAKTTFGKHAQKTVNLEPALTPTDALGGHFVLGHVDTVGKIKNKIKEGNSVILKIGFPSRYAKLVTEKGPITVDGVSLTVVKAEVRWFSVALINYTIKHTTLGRLKIGGCVNLEFDILAKYVNKSPKT